MTEIHYGVVRVAGRWRLIGQGLNLDSYDSRKAATRAALRLTSFATGLGVPVDLHMQDENGGLRRKRLRTDGLA
ncbi:hypothetical protein P7B02_16430 [Caulobacter segnis]|uniref:hypothetical protein n=1 Tax=Caulobacter segnis TaxID=88688 RepID=UPI00240F6F60|nr:hypothetical protein [Caulobacter segnis]MDG2523119.1 hypothetical protein [Caulobacter segnis]